MILSSRLSKEEGNVKRQKTPLSPLLTPHIHVLLLSPQLVVVVQQRTTYNIQHTTTKSGPRCNYSQDTLLFYNLFCYICVAALLLSQHLPHSTHFIFKLLYSFKKKKFQTLSFFFRFLTYIHTHIHMTTTKPWNVLKSLG